jgi:hypothetical protein
MRAYGTMEGVSILRGAINFAKPQFMINLGAEGGDAGGEIVIAGPPVPLIAHPEVSHTARLLREHYYGKAMVSTL